MAHPKRYLTLELWVDESPSAIACDLYDEQCAMLIGGSVGSVVCASTPFHSASNRKLSFRVFSELSRITDPLCFRTGSRSTLDRVLGTEVRFLELTEAELEV